MKSIFLSLLIILSISSCSKEDNEQIVDTPTPNTETDEKTLYFPPKNSDVWEASTPEALNWNTTELENLYTFLEDNDTRAFIILKDGKIVVEKYWGKNFLGTKDFTSETQWPWYSAGKTLTSFMIGMSEKGGSIDHTEKVSTYLGEGWTSMTKEQEDKITVKHLLSMTSGLDYSVSNPNCYTPDCLQYLNNPGEVWFYHNGAFSVLKEVIATIHKTTLNNYTDNNYEEKVGSNGYWTIGDTDYSLYFATARDAARFGLLLLNKGKWEDEELVKEDYFKKMINSSQDINKSYGYLTWLNGKSTIVAPGFTTIFDASLTENAPADLFAGIGYDGQFIDVIPSECMVVIRLGKEGVSLVPTALHDEMWSKISNVIP